LATIVHRPNMRALAALVIIVFVAGCGPVTPSPSPTLPEPTATAASPLPTSPSAVLSCQPDPEASELGDPCPSAAMAVQAVVARFGYPVTRIVIQPGRFFCGVLWPGVQSMPACLGGPATAPGGAMYGWVAFAGTTKVAAVSLVRDVPTTPGASPGPWVAFVNSYDVPPAGWLVP
jgi:hypothetical protein